MDPVPRPFHLFLRATFGLGTWQNFLDKCLSERQVDKKIFSYSGVQYEIPQFGQFQTHAM